jgi:hypothetical protein
MKKYTTNFLPSFAFKIHQKIKISQAKIAKSENELNS